MLREFVMAVLAMVFFGLNTCAAEDLKFIDSSDDVGYFIDADTIKIESPAIFRVNLVIIKINLNQMEVVELRINHEEKKYVILSTRTLSYDGRTEMTSDTTQHVEQSYSDKSLMGDIVNMVIYEED